jgi:hypothetical protein
LWRKSSVPLDLLTQPCRFADIFALLWAMTSLAQLFRS